jgi:hypothetical protein
MDVCVCVSSPGELVTAVQLCKLAICVCERNIYSRFLKAMIPDF